MAENSAGFSGFIMVQLASLVTAGIILLFSWLANRHPRKTARAGIPRWMFWYVRQTVYAITLLWGVAVYYQVVFSVPTVAASLGTLTRWYALSALFFLFAVFIPGVSLVYFPRFFLNPLLIHARRALGVSVFVFALIHECFAFYGNLSGNITSLFFLSSRNQIALVISAVALIVYFFMAITSVDIAVKKMGMKKWKWLHRWIYIASLLVLIHAFLIGSHFATTTTAIPVIVNYIALTIFILECGAIWKKLHASSATAGTFRRKLTGMALVLSVIAAISVSAYVLTTTYDPHAQHRVVLNDKYTLKVQTDPTPVTPQDPVTLSISVVDKTSNKPVRRFRVIQEKLLHLVIIRKDLMYYDHIHPEFDGRGTFGIVTQFPDPGQYYLFADYSPPDALEALSTAVLSVGSTPGSQAILSVDDTTKTFESQYRVTLNTPQIIRAKAAIDISYTLRDIKTGQLIVDLEPYLAAFGHMSAVSQDLSVYAHVHPLQIPRTKDDRGGPTIQFSTVFPKPGLYKLFTQFKHMGKVFVTDFVIEVK